MKTFAQLLTDRMEHKHLTDAALAAMIGCSTSTVCLWRSGRSTTPNLSYGVALCKALGVTASALVSACEKRD